MNFNTNDTEYWKLFERCLGVELKEVKQTKIAMKKWGIGGEIILNNNGEIFFLWAHL